MTSFALSQKQKVWIYLAALMVGFAGLSVFISPLERLKPPTLVGQL